MAKYIAKPVEVEAYPIIKCQELVGVNMVPGQFSLTLEIGEVLATPEMTARYKPTVGDYWVIQSDGYVYLNPKDVFERKYQLKGVGYDI